MSIIRPAAIGIAAAMALTVPAAAQQVAVPAFTLPPSNQLSDAARRVLDRMKEETAPASIAGDVAKQRAYYTAWNDRRLAEMNARFKTRVTHSRMGGVPVDIVDPLPGITAANRTRVLINVHGGAFMWGAGSGALVEAIPIAATGRIRVVTVDYRLAPEHRYPAASEDVAAVYRTLLKTYRPENIGIYGCSAGGVITAQATAWFRTHALPRPGAIGTFCGTGAPYSGDSVYLAGPITGGAARDAGPLPDVLPNPYMTGVAAGDKTAYPMTDPAAIAAMPPTLLLSGGRDFAASTLTLAHRRLAAAGVKSELYLFDGLPHAFFMWPDMPESIEAFGIIAGFFDRQLGHQPTKRKR
jgi:epsilon-lactone hydrolase